ncbi:MAG: 4'-phosphopantetheinyl transferase superfamily protein [Chloroflexi bacterium]|nr:4'-phosphopantetheinyl transferase superfamily protein [Ktedonobacteraceae bacterium]MBV9021124.1 4'-phosphopantetheinyl transferase superfamily protein [Ktedonobacteraceae bacterium]MBV9706936.1 4'-phosphopantetheinyl transferase superfamily protein [Chloroflexota bacterium]
MTSPDEIWVAPPAHVYLASKDVHVWRACLYVSPAEVERLQQMLAPDEWKRAKSFYFEKDRQRFIVARGLLRTILSLYLGTEPDALLFHYNAYGKPALVCTPGEKQISFNVSHTRGIALYAVTLQRSIGVDIEHIDAKVGGNDIVEHFFSQREISAFRALPSALQREAFFRAWTRKEAYIKARGEGLSRPLDQFGVSLAPGEPAALLETKDDPSEAARWSLRDLSAGSGYLAALAVEGHDWQLQRWQYCLK